MEDFSMYININMLKQELQSYYFANTTKIWDQKKTIEPFYQKMDELAAEHPDWSAMEFKTAQTELLADWFTPVLFPHSPFPSEMGLKPAENYGNNSAGRNWMMMRYEHLFADVDPQLRHEVGCACGAALHECVSYPDLEHHVFSLNNILNNGLSFYYEKAKRLEETTDNPEHKLFYFCAARSLLAIHKISQRFAEAAKIAAVNAPDEESRTCMSMIANSGESPWRKPETFYEGLSATWFLYEVTASVEGLAMGVIGHPDFDLIKLYQNDLAVGRITKSEARDLIGAFCCYIDNKQDFNKNLSELPLFGEQNGSLVLGGCDDCGNPVCNELTKLFLEVHREQNLVYPKLQVRFNNRSPQELYDWVNTDFLCGRNTIGIVNDNAVIKSQLKENKRLEDVRQFVVGGCWEVAIPNCEHSAGAMCYYNLPRVLGLSICPEPELERRIGEHFTNACDAKDFETFYRIVLDNTIASIRKMCKAISKGGKVTDQVLPAPFFSACMNDCLDNGKDYNAGGGRYNPHGLPLAGFATYLNSLLAIRYLCFEQKRYSLQDFQKAMKDNWVNYTVMRQEVLHVPYFWGDCNEGTLTLAQRVLNELSSCTGDIPSERGGRFQPALYNYHWSILGRYAQHTPSTPDGRFNGDYISQGIGPSHLRFAEAVSSVINNCKNLDLSAFSAGSVVTLSLTSQGMTLKTLAALERAFLETDVEMLQINCLSREELEDAMKHPEAHYNLIVRLYGLSSRFVKLAPAQQKEFIERHIY